MITCKCLIHKIHILLLLYYIGSRQTINIIITIFIHIKVDLHFPSQAVLVTDLIDFLNTLFVWRTVRYYLPILPNTILHSFSRQDLYQSLMAGLSRQRGFRINIRHKLTQLLVLLCSARMSTDFLHSYQKLFQWTKQMCKQCVQYYFISEYMVEYVIILCTTTFGDGLIILKILLLTSKILICFKQSQRNLNNTLQAVYVLPQKHT